MDSSSFRPAELTQQRDFLCRLARELLGDAGRAEDVVQDAFMLALERPPREERALSTWLGQVMRRCLARDRLLSRLLESVGRSRVISQQPCDEVGGVAGLLDLHSTGS